MLLGLNHLTLAVHDVERSFLFYRDLLGLTPLVKWHRGAYFLVGEKKNSLSGEGFWFCLNQDERHHPSDAYTHVAFTVAPVDFKRMAQRIADAGIVVFQENSSPGESLYFLDPDGHKLEIHVGNVDLRIAAKKEDPGMWQSVEWFI